MNKSVPILLWPGAKFWGKTISAGVVWQFTSRFIDKRMQPVPIWVAEIPYDLRKIQQRSFVRISAGVPLQYHILPDVEGRAPVTTTTKDISGGGLQLLAKFQLPNGTKLRSQLDLADLGFINVVCEVVRAEKIPESRSYTVAVKFIEITERDREKIVKYIFKKQTERRQKGL